MKNSGDDGFPRRRLVTTMPVLINSIQHESEWPETFSGHEKYLSRGPAREAEAGYLHVQGLNV